MSHGVAKRTSLAALAGVVLVGVVLVSVVLATALLTAVADAATAAPPEPLAPVTSADAKQQSQIVETEDIRLRSMFEKFGVLTAPTTVEVQGALPTVLLPARPTPYTVSDVIAAGAMRREVDGTTLMTKNVVVGPQAKLTVDPSVGTLRLASSPAGFASLVTWRGAIEIVGADPTRPLDVIGWNAGELEPDAVAVDGRAFVRALGGGLVLRNVRASNLGFWTGRTGGVAWSGSKGEPSTGGTAGSAFVSNTYGAYVSGSEGVTISDSTFQANERAGLAVQRDAVGTLVSGITSTENHGDGIAIDRASTTRIQRSTFTNNGGDGITLDGRSLGVVATATGTQVNQVKGTVIEENTVAGNGRYGIQVLGGEDTQINRNTVSDGKVGIILKSGANGTQIGGNTVSASVESGIRVGPDVRRTAITENKVGDAPIGILTLDSQVNIISRNEVTGATEFAVVVRGPSDGTTIGHNTLSGAGWRAVDVRKATGVAADGVVDNDTSGWVFRAPSHWYDLIREHPALLVWGLLVLFPLFGWWFGRRARRRPASHPYPESELLFSRLTGGSMRPPPSAPGRPKEIVLASRRDPATDRLPVHAGAASRGGGPDDGWTERVPTPSSPPTPPPRRAFEPPATRRDGHDRYPVGGHGGHHSYWDASPSISEDAEPTVRGLRYQRDARPFDQRLFDQRPFEPEATVLINVESTRQRAQRPATTAHGLDVVAGDAPDPGPAGRRASRRSKKGKR